MISDDLNTEATAWMIDDPDDRDRAELSAILTAAVAPGGGEAAARAAAELADRFAGHLEFGTAGLRGVIGAGPNRMNRAVVRGTTAALASWLLYVDPGAAAAGVVIGCDARHRSEDFAREAAVVLAGAGITVHLLPPRQPTPLLAFAVRHLSAAAGIMITASHNPPADNGYKLYLSDGAQIVPPADLEIEAATRSIGSLLRVRVASPDDPLIVRHGDEVAAAYLDAVCAASPAPKGSAWLRYIYTPLHGVAGDLAMRAFEQAGFPPPDLVEAQAKPDPDFRTVTFPNPEEPGTLDLALAQARRSGADLVLANDPDGDRLAVAVPDDDATGGWRMLTGDQLGALLGAYLLGKDSARAAEPGGQDGKQPLVVSTIVSATMLSSIAAAAGARYAETLTGFKWIARAGDLRPGTRFVYGYEEALGYTVGTTVRDKDGIGAALAVLGLAARARSGGESLLEAYDALEIANGVHLTEQVTISTRAPVHVMSRLRAVAPAGLGGQPVTGISDLTGGTADLPSADVLRYWLPGARVVIRPSGTEPKIKAYLQVVEPVIAGRLTEARRAARARMDPLAQAVRELLAELPDMTRPRSHPARGAALAGALAGMAALAGACLAGAGGARAVPLTARDIARPPAPRSVLRASVADDALSAVSCTGATCMAVGTYRSGGTVRGLSELLSAGTWTASAVPGPDGGARAVLADAVSCASAAMCALVGQHDAASGAAAQLAEAWNGADWTIISAAGPSGATWSTLNGVACPTAAFCLAVGAARNTQRTWATAYTWTSGSAWRPASVPPPPAQDRAHSAWLTGVACVTAADCMAVGEYATAHGQLSPYAAQWQQGSWQILAVPGARDLPRAVLRGVSCSATTECVAVGTVGPRGVPYAMGDLWILDLWRVVTTTPAPTTFNAVSCPSASLCLAAGFSGRHDLVEVQSWDGIHSTWVTQRTVQTTGAWPFDDFAGISCATPTDCEAVGYRYDSHHDRLTLAEQWDGQKWLVQATANP